MEGLLNIIKEISKYHVNLEKLQNEYETLLNNYIDRKKRDYHTRQAQTKQKLSKIFTTNNNTSEKSNNGTTFKKKSETEKKETNSEKSEDEPEIKPKPKPKDKNWDTYTFYEPDQKREKLVQKTLQRQKPKTNLKKILKKIYHRLLLKLHPDRSNLDNPEKICKKMIKCYKNAEYSFMFHMFDIIELKMHLSEHECKLLIFFLKQEVRRIQVSLKILNENINKFKL